MAFETSKTGTFRIQLPPDLLAEAARAQAHTARDLAVEGWKPSPLGRLVAIFSGRRAR